MPYAKVSPPPKHANGNKGSSRGMFKYLEKENEGIDKSADKEFFFSQDSNFVTMDEAIHSIDNNKKGLKNSETKFYEMSISLSDKETKHLNSISSDKNAFDTHMKDYTRNVMDDYAKNFNREINGNPMTANDLVYYAKIERTRRYDGFAKNSPHKKDFQHNYRIRVKAKDLRLIGEEKKALEIEKEYIKNKDGHVILPGQPKEGNNTHVHVVVSRRDKSQTVSLSPLANSRGSMNKLNGKDVKIGFDRDNFKERTEQTFDKQFGYSRDRKEFYQTLKVSKSLQNGISKFNTVIQDPEKYFGSLASSAIDSMFKKGISSQLNRISQQKTSSAIKKLTTNDVNKLKQLATKQLTKDLMKQSGSTLIKASLPVPATLALKAVSMAYNALKSKIKTIDKEIDR